MASQTPISDEIATRSNTLGFSFEGMLLPNPDPILRAQGKSIQTYREMRGDALIGSAIRRRKSAVRALDSGLDRGAASVRTLKAVTDLLEKLPMHQIIGQVLESTLYGYQPMEVVWAQVGTMLVPQRVMSRPPEWFAFDMDNRLRYMSVAHPMGQLLADKKFLLPRQDDSYDNPYGEADLSMCVWPLIFKKGGMKFWLNFAEKFGSAFAVGELPPNATDDEQETLLTALESLLQNAVATIPSNGTVKLIEMAGKSASADLYERLVMHCRGEITIALLGQNQTTEAAANLASATAGLEVTNDMRDAHAKLVATVVNELIGWFCELNFDGPAPVWSMWDQASQDKMQAARDKSNYDAGARFTDRYWKRAYGYQDGDLAVSAAPAGAGPAALAFADPVQPAADQDAIDALVSAELAQWRPMMAPMAATLQAALDKAAAAGESAEQLIARLPDLLVGMDADELSQALTRSTFTARLAGSAGIESA